MSSYRPQGVREPSGDHHRHSAAQGDFGRASYRDGRRPEHDLDRRSPPSPRRYSPPHDAYRGRRRPGSDDDSRGYYRDWDARRDQGRTRNYSRDRDVQRRARSPSSGRGRRGRYRDWDREDHHRSYGFDSRSRSQSRSLSRARRRSSSPYYGGPSSRDVIMEGLPPDMDSNDITEELHHGYHVEALEDVTVIKDRQTGASRQFGFLHFASVEAATAFLERAYPSIYLYGNGGTNKKDSRSDQATKVRISFCREKDDRERPGRLDEEWACQVCSFPNYARRNECRSCQSLRVEAVPVDAKPYLYTNTGDSDVSPDGAASQFLLFRGLESSVTAQLLAKGAAKLYKSSSCSEQPAAIPATKKAGTKVSSTTSGANLGAREGSLRRVLMIKDRKTDESWRYGFVEYASVEDSQAALAKFNSMDKFTISSKPVLLSFIHTGVFVPVSGRGSASDRYTFSPFNNPSMRLAYWDQDAYVSEFMLNSDDDPLSNPREGRTSSGGRPRGTVAAADEGLARQPKDGEGKTKKRKAEAGASSSNKKMVPAHLDFWRNRHAELHGMKAEDADQGTSGSSKHAKERLKAAPASDNGPPAQSFADASRKCCLLCARRFKSEAEMNRHERLSQLHRDNLTNEETRTRGLERLAKAGIETEGTGAYRDRAKERRATYQQPRRPAPESHGPQSARDAATETAGDEERAVPSKGAALLGKMGWTAGEGLGAQGTGIVAPVATDLYVQGVGLGAEGGKLGDAVEEASRNTTSSYGQFLERTKDKAKERFEQMG